MPTKKKQPYRAVSYCPHCGHDTMQRVLYTHSYELESYTSDGSIGPSLDAGYAMVLCEVGNHPLLYNAVFDFLEGGLGDLVWPEQRTLDKAVPKGILECYNEALKVKRLSPNAYALLIRRALELVCEDRKAGDGSLKEKLQQLSARGEIPPVFAEMAEVLRTLGNKGAHSAQGVGKDLTDSIDDFFRAVVEYVYVAPYRVKEVQRKLGKTKRTPRGQRRQDAGPRQRPAQHQVFG